jgi:hypothetical protein
LEEREEEREEEQEELRERRVGLLEHAVAW